MNATATNDVTTTTKARGFPALPCPRCNAEDNVSINLADLTGDEACHCAECEADFGLEEVRTWIERWTRVLAWVDLAPPVVD